MNIFLDDIRNPEDVTWIKLPSLPKGESWTVVRNYAEFVKAIRETGKPVERVCFDHDLADEHYHGDYTTEYTGLNCAKALIEICLDNGWKLPKYVVHSMNVVGKKNIEETLKSATRWF